MLWTDAHLVATRLDQPANADPVDPSWASGAGSYLGTPEDLVRFGLALDSRDGIVVAIATNIEFDQPAELMGELAELVRLSP